MGSFGNYLGATMGTSTNEEGRSGAIYDNAFVTNSNYPQRAALVGPDGKFVQVDDFSAPTDTDPNKFKPNSALLGEVPGLLSDDTTYNEVRDALSGGDALNWEDWTFAELRDRKGHAEARQARHAGNSMDRTTATPSRRNPRTFKKSVENAITGKWEGESAEAAEAATQQVTKTSIYDFTPSSDALSDRLTVLQ